MGTPDRNTHLNVPGNCQPEMKRNWSVSRKRMLLSRDVSHVKGKIMRPDEPFINIVNTINNPDVSLDDVDEKCKEYENSSDGEPCLCPDVMDGDSFQQIHDATKLPPMSTEKLHDEYGISVRDGELDNVSVTRKRTSPVNKKVMRSKEPIRLSRQFDFLDTIINPNISPDDVNKICQEYEYEKNPEEVPRIRNDVMLGDTFQQIHDKVSPISTEKRCDEYGIHVRDGEPSPEEDCSLYNVNRYCVDVGLGGHISEAQYGDCSRERSFNSLTVKPTDPGQNGRITSGTEKECQGMFATKMLPSQHSTGIILKGADLRPSPEGHYQQDEQFEVEERVGQGSQGTVTSCVDTSTKKAFVIKKGNGRARFNQHEAEILLSLKHDNIPKLYGFIDRGGIPEILLENCGLSLTKLVTSTTNYLTEDKIIEYNRQALLALRYLAIHKILHLDIKPDNICVLNDVLKIVDFGSACLPQEKITCRCWTVEYMSPEACRMFWSSYINSEKLPWKVAYTVTSQADMFAWGLTVLFMYRKEHVLPYFVKQLLLHRGFEVDDDMKLRNEILRMVALNPNCVKDFLIPDSCSVNIKDLLFWMLDGNPEIRITPDEAIKKIQLQDNETTAGIPLSGAVERIAVEDKDKNLTVENRRSENAASCVAGNIPNLPELMWKSNSAVFSE